MKKLWVYADFGWLKEVELIFGKHSGGGFCSQKLEGNGSQTANSKIGNG